MIKFLKCVKISQTSFSEQRLLEFKFVQPGLCDRLRMQCLKVMYAVAIG